MNTDSLHFMLVKVIWQKTTSIVWVNLGPPFWEAGRIGVSDSTIRKSDVAWFPNTLSIVTISNHSAAICHRMSPRRSNHQGWENLGRNGLTDVS